MNELRLKQKENFTSYVKESFNDNFASENLSLKLLAGELEAARVNNVCMYTAHCVKDNKYIDEKEGALIITNFRLSFLSVENDNDELSTYQKNTFLGKYDVSLSNIDKIYQVTDRKKRVVSPPVKNSRKIEIIRIVCKNFRTFTFGFRKAGIGKGKYIADALVKFAFPAKHNLLFLYNYKEKYYNSSRSVCMFNKKIDWLNEIKRCSAEAGWRVFSKDKMDMDSTLPMNYVVPKHLADMEYFNISRSFRNCRSAIWVWGIEDAALVRMAELSPEIASSTIENTMLEHVRKCDPQKRAPHLMELSKLLPGIQEVNESYLKLRKLCVPENDREFMAQDARFYSLLDKTYWLLYVSVCLKQSVEAAKLLTSGNTVVLQEINGRDMSSVISSIVQLLLDKTFRTIHGIQTLIQKEWVSLGHPFNDRMGHVCNGNPTECSPLFLLFLDCVWQLLQQFPEEFEFSETFLTSLWDSVFLPVFDTFQFNCESDRQKALLNDHIILRPVWDWGEQFSDQDIALFSNPLYKKPPDTEHEIKLRLPPSAFRLPCIDDVKENHRQSMNHSSESVAASKAPNSGAASSNFVQHSLLVPRYAIRDIEIWHQCYFRWIPFLEITNGGYPQVDMFNRSVLNSIHKLEKILHSGNLSASNENILLTMRGRSPDFNSSTRESRCVDPSEVDGGVKMPLINSFFPFTSNVTNTEELLDILVTNGEYQPDGSIMDSASINY
ncbi:myotubularin-related protein 10 [Uranotaenia lowii]|uniref:myotubularin-related protein 10 n=1 Tax=Uranotaenia lowii TaxID=190385 RepID=UPI0024796E29|nr:myotubularin-related protein 10 [Uranotaenia lowii]XP_055600130.1 myotubularin-related protein 10 [Uranotaenia lowii]